MLATGLTQLTVPKPALLVAPVMGHVVGGAALATKSTALPFLTAVKLMPSQWSVTVAKDGAVRLVADITPASVMLAVMPSQVAASTVITSNFADAGRVVEPLISSLPKVVLLAWVRKVALASCV